MEFENGYAGAVGFDSRYRIRFTVYADAARLLRLKTHVNFTLVRLCVFDVRANSRQ